MHALIVFPHPDGKSLTAALARTIAEAVERAGHTAEIGDIAAEGFDPRHSLADRAVHHREADVPADVAAEQARLNRAHALVIVYPVYWWSMPALLKGWIDRVFSNGWAFEDGPGGTGLVRKLTGLQVHLIALAGSDLEAYTKHGYFGAMKTQIDHGIFGYCGAPVIQTQLLVESETQDPSLHFEAVRELGSSLFKKFP